MLTIDHLEKRFGSTVLFRDLTFTVDGPAVLWAPSGWHGVLYGGRTGSGLRVCWRKNHAVGGELALCR